MTELARSPEAHGSSVAEHSRAILSTSAVLITRKVVVTVAAAVTTAVLARALAVSDFGVYSAALATLYLATSVCDLGFGTVLARELATRPLERPVLLRAAVRAATACSVLVAVALAGASVLVGETRPGRGASWR